MLALLAPAFALAAGGKTQPREVRLLFTGDIMLSREVQVELERTHASPWNGFKPLFRSADFVMGNFEGAVGTPEGCAAEPCFAVPLALVQLPHRARFSALSVENNHAGDLGTIGREETASALAKAGMLPLSFAASPKFLRFGEHTVAVIAISVVAGRDGLAQPIPSVAIAQKLRLARRLANLVVVSIHWGNELQDWPSEAQRAQAAWLVRHGADLVVGHHPHVVQAPQCIAGKPVFFSLGNHVFDQKYPETKDGLIADCRIAGRQLRCGALRTRTRPGTAIPQLDGRDAAAEAGLAKCPVALAPDLTVAGTTIKPQPWRAPSATSGIPAPRRASLRTTRPPETEISTSSSQGLLLEGWRDGRLQWRSRPQRLLSVDVGRLAGAAAEPLLFTIERHYSPLDDDDAPRPYVYAVGPRGLIAKWRGSALAWPLLDATLDPGTGSVCALHRGDAFVTLQPGSKTTRVAAYVWNGFGFNGMEDETVTRRCAALFQP